MKIIVETLEGTAIPYGQALRIRGVRMGSSLGGGQRNQKDG